MHWVHPKMPYLENHLSLWIMEALIIFGTMLHKYFSKLLFFFPVIFSGFSPGNLYTQTGNLSPGEWVKEPGRNGDPENKAVSLLQQKSIQPLTSFIVLKKSLSFSFSITSGSPLFLREAFFKGGSTKYYMSIYPKQ